MEWSHRSSVSYRNENTDLVNFILFILIGVSSFVVRINY